ncbi:MAG: hypothetical protein KF764_23455 [Labilithrix sp.]|nr:hypothetical protein [Labilithrix sp.]MBX3222923.1 hypothetical protein [Labilithrix sp.]
MRASRLALASVVATLALVASPGIGRADEAAAAPVADAPALGPLLSRLARHAQQFEEMKRRGSFTLSGRMEELDRSGQVDGRKEMVVRFTATPAERFTEVVRYTEDGADKTAEARKKAEKRRAERKAGKLEKARDLHLPFLASEQPRYTFSFLERDPGDSSRVRLAFAPLVAAENAFKGSAWVDERAGEVLTMGLSPSKNPTFVDHVDVTLRFDLATPLGRAPSSITFDARGSFLLFRKHYRGSATITDPRLGF